MGELACVEEVDGGVVGGVEVLEDACAAAGADGDGADGDGVDAGPGGDLDVAEVESGLDAGDGVGERDGAVELDDAAHADAGDGGLVGDDDAAGGLDAAGTHAVGKPVVDAADGGVDGGVGRVDADVVADELDERAVLGVVGGGDAVELAEEERVVRDDDVAALADGLVGNGLGQVDGEQDPRGGGGGVAGVGHRRVHQQPRVVPRVLGVLQRVELVHRPGHGLQHAALQCSHAHVCGACFGCLLRQELSAEPAPALLLLRSGPSCLSKRLLPGVPRLPHARCSFFQRRRPREPRRQASHGLFFPSEAPLICYSMLGPGRRRHHHHQHTPTQQPRQPQCH